jgi:hypothetical protein
MENLDRSMEQKTTMFSQILLRELQLGNYSNTIAIDIIICSKKVLCLAADSFFFFLVHSQECMLVGWEHIVGFFPQVLVSSAVSLVQILGCSGPTCVLGT